MILMAVAIAVMGELLWLAYGKLKHNRHIDSFGTKDAVPRRIHRGRHFRFLLR